ncbi:hypothetical protein AS4_06030 [Acinetobacter guillouiae]|nr:hypothetical protein AS4_06030 [Acinetobacter guillouiae]
MLNLLFYGVFKQQVKMLKSESYCCKCQSVGWGEQLKTWMCD